MSDEPDDDDLLTETQIAALQAARHALVETIERLIGDDERQIVQLVFIAVGGLLADMLSASAGIPKLVDVINQQIAESGWQLVPMRRN
jgi:predicted esterase YcpF (UPF0227 family)